MAAAADAVAAADRVEETILTVASSAGKSTAAEAAEAAAAALPVDGPPRLPPPACKDAKARSHNDAAANSSHRSPGPVRRYIKGSPVPLGLVHTKTVGKWRSVAAVSFPAGYRATGLSAIKRDDSSSA